MYYLASISAWLAPYGPVIWGAIGIGAFAVVILSLGGALALVGLFRERSEVARISAASRNIDFINPLEKNFENRRINTATLFHNFFRPIEGATFRSCEFFGPGAILLNSGHLTQSTINHCDLIIIKDDAVVTGAAMLQNCHITNCIFWRVPIYMNAAVYAQMKQAGLQVRSVTHEPS